jgi:hypothetical protein
MHELARVFAAPNWRNHESWMNNLENPYRPPDSPLERVAVDEADLNQVVLLARRSAKTFLTYACILPILWPLQAYNLLTPYGAEGKIDILLMGQLRREGLWLAGLTIMAIMMLKACRGIAAGALAKVDALRFACGGAIALDVMTYAIALELTPEAIRLPSAPFILILRCAWLAYLMHRLNKAYR